MRPPARCEERRKEEDSRRREGATWALVGSPLVIVGLGWAGLGWAPAALVNG